MESTLFADMETAELCAALDNACKRLLSEKSILAWILHTCLDEYKEIPVREIAEQYIEGTPEIGTVGVLPEQTNRIQETYNGSKIQGLPNDDASINEGNVRYDIRFRAIAPSPEPEEEYIQLIINVEAQNQYYTTYPLITRAMYYLSRMLSAQHGTEFEHSHYEKIKKVYSIWVCTDPPKERQNTIVRYHMAEELFLGDPKHLEAAKEKKSHYDLLSAIVISLQGGRADIHDDDTLMKLLDVLLSNTTDVATKKKILSEDFEIPMTSHFESEVEHMCNIGAGYGEKRYQQGIEEGMQKGMQKGIEKGMQKGIENEKINSLRALLRNFSLSFDQAATVLEIAPSELDKYRKLVEQYDLHS